MQAARITAAAQDRVADAILALTEAIAPAANVIAGGGHRLDALCFFLKKRGPWLLASVPVVLTSVGAITPDAAKGIHALVVAFLPQP